MSKVNLNKISLKQDGGGMMQQPAQQVDPALKQIGSFFTTAVQQGQQPEQVVMSLMQQEVDQQTIAQALMLVGYQEKQLTQLFNNIADMQVKENQPASAEEITSNPQELARAEEIEDESMGLPLLDEIDPMAKSGIEIKPENKGKFTRWAKSRGMTVKEAYRKVLANKDRYPASVVKMANFARNAAGWDKGKKAETGQEMLDAANQFANVANSRIVDQDNVILAGNAPKQEDEGFIQPGPFYVDPNAFKVGNNFSLGKAANVLLEGYEDMFSGEDKDGDGLKDGSFRDWAGKAERNRANKFANADYTFKFDLSDENLENIKAYRDSLEEDATVSDVVEDAGIQVDQDLLQKTTGAVSNFLEQNVENLSGAALETYNALKKKLQGNKRYGGEELPQALFGFGKRGRQAKQKIKEDPIAFARLMAGDVSAIPGMMAKVGVELPRAQFAGQPGFMDFDPYDPNFDMGDYLQQFTQTDYQRDMNTIIPPAQQRSASSDVVDNSTVEQEGPSSEELFARINQPTVDINTGGVGGFLDRLKNSNVARAFGDVSNFAVKAADVVNDFFEDEKIAKAKIDLRNSMVADNIYGTKTDPFNSRGTFDINSGLMGSEGDATTGLYLTKEGKELPASVDNPGFRALPPSAQKNILDNMPKKKYGGPKGEDAYLARRDAAIKASIAQQKAMMGGEKNIVNVDSDMLAKLIAAGADIEML